MPLADLVRRCAWCGAVDSPVGWVPAPVPDAERTTHGICDGCFDRLERERVGRISQLSTSRRAAA